MKKKLVVSLIIGLLVILSGFSIFSISAQTSLNVLVVGEDIDDYLNKPIQYNVKKSASITSSVFHEEIMLPDSVVDFSQRLGLSLPVRLHDLGCMERLFPIGAFEFHLSFGEILSEIDITKINPSHRCDNLR